MPFKQQEVDAELFFEHKGTSIYHVYVDNNADEKSEYLYTTDSSGDCYMEDEVIDVSMYGEDPEKHAEILKAAIESGTLQKLRETGEI